MTDTTHKYGVLPVQMPPVTPESVAKRQIFKLCLDALLTNGGHHKQWYLEEIMRTLIAEERLEKLRAKHEWEEGIAP